MKIFFDDGMQIRVGTGIGKYSKYLIAAVEKLEDIEVELTEYQSGVSSQIIERIKYLIYINSERFMNQIKDTDIVHFTNYVIPFRRKGNVKYAVTIHDMVAFLYPETLPKAYRIYNQLMIKHSLKYADIIFTVSESVKKEILELFPDVKAPIKITYNGVINSISDTVGENYDSQLLSGIKINRFFLFVGTIEKRKNIGTVIEAFLKLKENCKFAGEYKLVLAGREGYGCNEFHDIVDKSKYGKDVVFTGYITDNDRNRLYNNATAFVFPSIYEGFGVPQVECMLCGLPTILSDIPVNREVSQDCGAYFELGNTDSLVERMQEFILGKYDKSEIREKAKKIVQKFNWDEIARDYILDMKMLLHK